MTDQGSFMKLQKPLWPWLILAFASGCAGFFSPVFAANEATPAPAKVSTPGAIPEKSPTAETKDASHKNAGGQTDDRDSATDEGEEAEKSFLPHWTGQLGLSYSNQPSQAGQGQTTQELNFTGTYNFTEGGHYMSFALAGGQQMLEGSETNYGAVTVEGGLGLGFFLPSVSVGFQQGAAALNSYGSTLNLNFQLYDPLTVGMTGGAGIESHQGPTSVIFPNSSNPDAFKEVDSYNWNLGAVVTFEPWEFLTLSLTAQEEFDTTYQIQNIAHTNSQSLNSSDQIPSVTLGADVTLSKSFVFELSGQAGQEYYPAGTVFSPVQGKTVNFSKPTQQGFSGFSAGLVYNLQ